MKKYFSFVKIEHTLFSLPIIYAGMLLGQTANAARGVNHTNAESWRIGFFVLLAATGARTVGFAMNRIIDRRIDARNPRTAKRDLPAGTMSLSEAYAVMAVGVIVYLAAAAQLNLVCLLLSPIPLLVFLTYPYLKRFTPLAHFGVGLSLALGPLGAYFAVRPSLEGVFVPALLSLFTWLWVSGFDIIYSTADEGFDRKEGLFSMPSIYGKHRALQISGVLHILAFTLLCLIYATAFAWDIVGLVLLLIAGVLLYFEQKKAEDVEMAFFKINAVVGFVVLLFVIVGVTRT